MMRVRPHGKFLEEKGEEVSANILEWEVKTNCPQGGDGGHGGVTEIVLKDGGGTGWEIEVEAETRAIWRTEQPARIVIRMKGDAEAVTIRRALGAISRALDRCISEGRVEIEEEEPA